MNSSTLLELADSCVGDGHVHGTGGNLSMRLDQGRFGITATDCALDAMSDEKVCILNGSWEVVSGPRPSTEWRAHRAVYRSAESAVYVAHIHMVEPVVLMAMRAPLTLFMLEHAMFASDTAFCLYDPPGSQELAEAVEGVAENHRNMVLEHHGVLIWGQSIKEVRSRLRYLREAASWSVRISQASGSVVGIPPELAQSLEGI